MRTIVVTDIHGCLAELESVWEQAQFDPKKDRLICLGDLMDRGPRLWAKAQCTCHRWRYGSHLSAKLNNRIKKNPNQPKRLVWILFV